MYKFMLFCLVFGFVIGLPVEFATQNFFVGIEYEKSLPMEGGSDRLRHRNNFDPFYVTITTSAKKGFVLSYLEVTATTDVQGEVEFCLLHGQAGSQTMVFQLSSNNTDFLTYTYKSYGIREENYKKMVNYIIIPINEAGSSLYKTNIIMLFISALLCIQYFL